MHRIVLLGDGVVTAGADGKGLLNTAKDLGRRGVERLDVIAFGGIRDQEGLQALVTAGLARGGAVIDSQRGANDAWRRLNLATQSGVAVEVAGASWWWPRELDGVQPGDEVLIHAQVPQSTPVQIRLDGEAVPGLRFVAAERPLVERSWARAKIASLVEDERRHGRSKKLKQEIVDLSTKHRVLSPYTSMLVLETQRDYDRYKLDRDALADILEVRNGRIAVAQRQKPMKPKASPPPPDQAWSRDDSLGSDPLSASGNMWGEEIGESFGAGGLGLVGVGEGGGGTGEGIGLGSAQEAAEFGMIGLLGQPPAAAPQPSAPPTGTSAGQGFGSGQGRLGRTHRARPPQVRMGTTNVSGRLPPEVIQRIVRANFGRLRGCYQALLRRSPNEQGRVTARFVIKRDGSVGTTTLTSEIASDAFKTCIVRGFKAMTYPVPEGGVVTVSYPVVFTPNGSTAPLPAKLDTPVLRRPSLPQQSPTVTGTPPTANAYEGRFGIVMNELRLGNDSKALIEARRWHATEPANVLALVALGEAYEARAMPKAAARAYGSIIDLFPSRADLRRYAGERLDRLDGGAAKRLAIDTYEKAKAQRPDHPTSHRLLGYAWLRNGDHEKAFAAVAEGLAACTGRYVHASTVLRRDLGLIAAAWLRVRPKQKEIIEARLVGAGATLATTPSLQLVLNWETDANDVDLHVYSSNGGHAYYEHQHLLGGGRLHGDVTTGYGPELFTIDGANRARGYRFQVNYFARGPMGYGMGKLHVIEHDGKGKLTMDSRPFVVMRDKAYVDVGTLGKWGKG
jgi:hypothetical protein